MDFCRYYAAQAREHFGAPRPLVGPTGEKNLYSLHGRGAFVCISPWNFPLAIFIGQVTAALAAGNSVLAKPAEQTPLIAAAAVNLLHRSGLPVGVLRPAARPGREHRRRAGRGRANRRRGHDRLHRDGQDDCTIPVAASGTHHSAHCRDRGAERDVCRFHGIAGAGRGRRRALGFLFRRSALFGTSGAVRAGGGRRRHHWTCSRARWTS